MITVKESDLFHIHTFRCLHAEEVPDEEYIRKAVSVGKTGIWFTDHAPFPGDPFGHRMRMAQLTEYLDTLCALKEKYKGICEVHIGLETEYFPSFYRAGYYKELLSDSRLEFLLLGQHMAEDPDGGYSYDWEKERLDNEEWTALCGAIIEGMKSGYFIFVAHPDRSFRRCKNWTEEMEEASRQMHALSVEKDIPMEINLHSFGHRTQFWPQFWAVRPKEERIIYGLDAHAVKEIEARLDKLDRLRGEV
ncbi:MAG: PHP domain-containing protein [Lachnospiraceae bacterium]|nr:PHP domain-containing protein [Lachnospiraceae bacterium]